MIGTSLWPWLDDFRCSELDVFTPNPRRDVDLDALPLKSRRGMLGAALISVGLVGALAWVWWRRRQAPELAPVLAATPPVFADSAPWLVPLELPQSAEEIDEILGVARKCLQIAPSHPDHELASLAWGFIWKGEPFPGRPRPGDHPSIAQALDVVLHAIAVARTEARDSEVVAAPAKRCQIRLEPSSHEVEVLVRSRHNAVAQIHGVLRVRLHQGYSLLGQGPESAGVQVHVDVRHLLELADPMLEPANVLRQGLLDAAHNQDHPETPVRTALVERFMSFALHA